MSFFNHTAEFIFNFQTNRQTLLIPFGGTAREIELMPCSAGQMLFLKWNDVANHHLKLYRCNRSMCLFWDTSFFFYRYQVQSCVNCLQLNGPWSKDDDDMMPSHHNSSINGSLEWRVESEQSMNRTRMTKTLHRKSVQFHSRLFSMTNSCDSTRWVKMGGGTGSHSCQSNTAAALFRKHAACCLFELFFQW